MSDYNPIVPIDTSPRNGSVNVGTNGQGGVTADVASAKPVSVTISSKETSIGASVRRDGMVDIDISGRKEYENDYNKLVNKPQLNGVTLKDNKSLEDVGMNSLTAIEIFRICT